MTLRYRKSPRLKDFEYEGAYAYFVTIVTRARHRAFILPRHAHIALAALHESLSKQQFTAHAYCLMPDHLHLLVSGTATSRLTDFVHHLKTISGYRYKQAARRPLWQISYHDHVLRREEAIGDVARYIWENPLRAGLAED